MLLIYSPPLLDILPMYILFMLISPVLLLHGLQQGWLGIMLISVALWLAAQWEIGRVFYDIVATPTRMPVPLGQTGAFDIFAWQFLWVFGLWLGSRHAVGEGGADMHFPRWLVALALVIGVGCMVWRHVVGQAPFRGDAALNLLFDKWRLGPLRLIDFFALVVLTMRFGPWLKAHLPRSRFLETLGAAALPVFCAHLVLVLLVLALLGANTDEPAVVGRPRHPRRNLCGALRGRLGQRRARPAGGNRAREAQGAPLATTGGRRCWPMTVFQSA